MAIVKNLLLSGMTGQVGNMVIYKVNGQTIIRRKPERKQPYKASNLQRFNQLAFREVQQFLLPLKDLLEFGFGEYTEGMKKGIHQAMSLAMRHAVTGEDDKVILHKTEVKVSDGDLPLPLDIRLVRESESQLRIDWDSAGSMGNARVTDQSWVVLYHSDEKKVQEIRGGSHRELDSQLVPLNGVFREGGVLVFLSFYRKKSGKKWRFSESICFELNQLESDSN
jgi:hypothetical protein